MTRCRDVERLVTAYVDGELDDRRSSAVRGHLRVCSTCAERVEDEARVRELAGEMEPIDPPQTMWQAIDARLAEEEIGDSHRSGLWLLVQRGLDGARRNRLLVGVGAAACAVLLILWLPGGGSPEPAVAPPARVAAQPAAPPAAQLSCGDARTHEELVQCQMRESDQRYLDAIAELNQVVAEERAEWSEGDASRFDSELAELGRAAELELVRLAGQPSGPAGRDPLHAIYRQQIDLLTSAVVAGDPSGPRSRRGEP